MEIIVRHSIIAVEMEYVINHLEHAIVQEDQDLIALLHPLHLEVLLIALDKTIAVEMEYAITECVIVFQITMVLIAIYSFQLHVQISVHAVDVQAVLHLILIVHGAMILEFHTVLTIVNSKLPTVRTALDKQVLLEMILLV